MHSTLLSFISRYVQLTSKEEERVIDTFSFREVPEKYKIVELGSISKELYFIKKGCGRLFYLKEGVEITGFLFTENMFIGSFESFLTGTPSNQIIEMEEASSLYVLSKENLEMLYTEIPKINVFVRKMLEERMIIAQQLVGSFVLNKPEERYEAMLRANPDLLNRFPQHILATFLGITPVSLSRIRQRIIKKEQ